MTKYENAVLKFYSEYYNYSICILDSVVQKMEQHKQSTSFDKEAGGVLMGYKVKCQNQIIIDNLSTPKKDDRRSRVSFVRQSLRHIEKIKREEKNKSFCIGNWHTHPGLLVFPSSTDYDTWVAELAECKSSFGYQIFIICSCNGFKVWMGKEGTQKILECRECQKKEGLYVKELYNGKIF